LLPREDDAAATWHVGGRLLARVALVRLGVEALRSIARITSA
jgi:hypothetical protein